MKSHREINVQSFIDAQQVSRMQVTVLVLCFCVVAVDGFDTASIAFIAPALRAEWQLTTGHLSVLFGAGLAGLMTGALLFGPLADRYGRKTIMLASVAFFGAASLCCGLADSLPTLAALRFLTGIGLGGAMPMSVTLSSEYSPQRHRSVLVTAMFCGLTLGSGLGGVLAAHIVNQWGWRPVLVLGGVLPLGLVPFLMVALPESATYLVMRGANPERVRGILQRIAPAENLSSIAWTAPAAPAGSPVGRLFDADLRRGTALIWLTFFMSLLVIYLLSNWLPTLIKSTGMSLMEASLITAMFQAGGTVGAISLGQMMDRFQPSRVLGIAYLMAAGFTALIGSSAGHRAALMLSVFGAGFCVSGGQVGVNALAAAYYPTANRATGVSWASGIGRIGSFVGVVAGGWMVALGMELPVMFSVIGIPALIACAALFAMNKVLRARKPSGDSAVARTD
jgi:AAHS family 4-hydroxybenzoate transporter-like MFS transporter